jgi:hypothetical protein
MDPRKLLFWYYALRGLSLVLLSNALTTQSYTLVLFVAFYASAELGCYRVQSWPMPERILDLFVEFRDRTNGLTTPAGRHPYRHGQCGRPCGNRSCVEPGSPGRKHHRPVHDGGPGDLRQETRIA